MYMIQLAINTWIPGYARSCIVCGCPKQDILHRSGLCQMSIGHIIPAFTIPSLTAARV